MSYQTDRGWSDRHLAMVKRIIGPLLLQAASIERDRDEATDLIVLRADGVTVGVRLRRRSAGYWRSFPEQFTLRCRRDSGALTELSKIINGWGQWFFYGHADDGLVDPWMLLDLGGLRAAFQRYPRLLRDPRNFKSNGDGTHFVALNRRELPPYVTIASSVPDTEPEWRDRAA